MIIEPLPAPMAWACSQATCKQHEEQTSKLQEEIALEIEKRREHLIIFLTCSGGISSFWVSTNPNFLLSPYLLELSWCHFLAFSTSCASNSAGEGGMLYDGCTAGGGGGGIPAPGTVPGGAIGAADDDDDDDEAPPFHISNSTSESKSPDEGRGYKTAASSS
ncbi:hypothetical protein BHE74_00002308 [Ensete ventricosum]|nr:hypothetical protein GW17_00004200 [Ensete ventricosum]RWW88796.1 hypothetical protein BHE74_00002308 [Ensete ventricosum]RZR85161.1 hypothetical protein BHM03_00012111 [Ensete ventricosum]